MKISHELVTKAGILPKLRLGIKQEKGGVVSTGPHTVKLLEDKIIKGLDRQTGKEIFLIEYTVEEAGVKRSYQTKMNGPDGKPSYLVQRLSEINEGEEVVLEMKKAGPKNYVEVKTLSDGSVEEVDLQEEHEEIIEDESIKDIVL